MKTGRGFVMQGDGGETLSSPAMIMTVTGPVLPTDVGPGVMSFQEHLFIKSSPLLPPKGTEDRDKMQVCPLPSRRPTLAVSTPPGL